MAILTVEGTIEVELVDVYAWLESRGTPIENARRMLFSTELDALVIEFSDAEPIGVDAAEFWAWLISKQLPAGISNYETVFGVPKEQGADLVIHFAAGNCTDPRSWRVPPACLAEWKQTP